MNFNAFTSSSHSDSRICMLITVTEEGKNIVQCVYVYLCVRVCANIDGGVGDWSCHQLAVEMTVDYWAAAT